MIIGIVLIQLELLSIVESSADMALTEKNPFVFLPCQNFSLPLAPAPHCLNLKRKQFSFKINDLSPP